MFNTVSTVTYVAGPFERRTRRAAVLFLLIAAGLLGYHLGDQPHAVASCQTQHSDDTCSLALR